MSMQWKLCIGIFFQAYKWIDGSPYIYQKFSNNDNLFIEMFKSDRETRDLTRWDITLTEKILEKISYFARSRLKNTTDNCTAILVTPFSKFVWTPIPCNLGFEDNYFICEKHVHTFRYAKVVRYQNITCRRKYVFVKNKCAAMTFKYRVQHYDNDIHISHLHFFLSAWSYGQQNRFVFCSYAGQEICYKTNSLESQRIQSWSKIDYVTKTDNYLMIRNVMLQESECNTNMGRYFVCKNMACVLSKYICDMKVDCLDGSDEHDCDKYNIKICGELYFTCLSTECLPLSERCDGKGQCKDNSDEIDCVRSIFYIKNLYRNKLILKTKNTTCPVEWSLCEHTEYLCFPTYAWCIYKPTITLPSYCPNLEHLHHCETYECPNMFKCNNTYCIPISLVCNEISDCPSNEDEAECESYNCPGLLKCRYDDICIHPSEICDGIVQCRLSNDDESMCHITLCPIRCHCRGDVFRCTDTIPTINTVGKLRGLFIVNTRIVIEWNKNNNLMLVLSIRYSIFINGLIGDRQFSSFVNIEIIHLEKNNIILVGRKCFENLNNLQILYLNDNPIIAISSYAFTGVNTLPYLNLSHIFLRNLNEYVFDGLTNLKFLNLSSNRLSVLHINVFRQLTKLIVLDLRQNNFIYISKISSLELINGVIYLDKHLFCCYVNDKIATCRPKESLKILKHSKTHICYHILIDSHIAYINFIAGTVILTFNIFTMMHQSHVTNRCQVVLNRFVVLSDSFVAVYVILLSCTSVALTDNFIGVFIWTQSQFCVLLGSLTSVGFLTGKIAFIIAVINHLLITKYALKRRPFSRIQIVFFLCCGWISSICFEGIRIMYLDQNHHNRNLCLPFMFRHSNHFDKIWNSIYISVIFVIISIAVVIYKLVVNYIQMSQKAIQVNTSTNMINLINNICISVGIEVIGLVVLLFIIFCVYVDVLDSAIVIIALLFCTHALSVSHALFFTGKRIVLVIRASRLTHIDQLTKH